MIARLKADHSWVVGKTNLYKAMKELKITNTSRKNKKKLSEEVKRSLVVEKIEDDQYRRNGPQAIQDMLAREHNIIPRDEIRQIMKTFAPEGFILRRPGRHISLPRGKLLQLGPWQELHADGHEKLCSSALRMGPVGIAIYGFRQHVRKIELLVVVPDARKADAVGHLHLDVIEKNGKIPIQMTVDKGSETGELYAQQVSLRTAFSDLDTVEYPPFVALTSTHNITIESCWKWLHKYNGIGIREVLEQGKNNGLFQPTNPLHCDLFHWLWPKIVQGCLDEFVDYWNKHKIRTQDGVRTSGTTPNQIMACPELYGLVDCSIPVDTQAVDALRGRLPPRKEVLRWVSDEFEVVAQAAYEAIGNPPLTGSHVLGSGWTMFAELAETIDILLSGETN
ncbi:hypothetical protein PM082_018519 [Marasmius tenuissimus]|nr:hypothetical protein PM082_018519 [Marasmius tenuissimus]